jgi:hypothetical protein
MAAQKRVKRKAVPRKRKPPKKATRRRALPKKQFEDYNENHPHKALRLKSPREFIRSYQPAESPVG